jgi:hypothetical protein
MLPWLAGLLLQGALAAVLLVKRMWSRFPVFTVYSVLNFVFSLSAYFIYQSSFGRHVYIQVYWVNEVIGLLLGLGVIYEIFSHLLSPYPALRKLASQIFQTVIVLLILLGCILVYAQPLGERSHIQAALLIMEQAGRILEVGLLGFLFLFASAFGLHWRQYLFGIAVGLGVFVTVELVAVTMRVQFGMTANSIFNIVRTISFNSSLLLWIGYILAPELAVAPTEVPKRAQLEQWNKAIMELIYQ